MNDNHSARDFHQQTLIDQIKNMSRQAYEKSGKKTSPQRKGHQKTDG